MMYTLKLKMLNFVKQLVESVGIFSVNSTCYLGHCQSEEPKNLKKYLK